jgi:hypothetical protein
VGQGVEGCAEPTPLGSHTKKAPHPRGLLIFIASPDSVVRRQLLPAGAADFLVRAANGTSHHHEHLNFPGRNVWSCCSGFYREAPRVHSRALSFHDNHNKFAAAVTRARVDPQVSVVKILQLNGFYASPPNYAETRIQKFV